VSGFVRQGKPFAVRVSRPKLSLSSGGIADHFFGASKIGRIEKGPLRRFNLNCA
jgi:hypothetical protein